MKNPQIEGSKFKKCGLFSCRFSYSDGIFLKSAI